MTKPPYAARQKIAPAQQVVLWSGDSLEIRGEKLDYLQVYDHRRERAGYVKSNQLRLVSLKAEDAAESLALLRFLRDSAGSESLGISYAAAYLKAAPNTAASSPQWPEALDALGSMAERLARRASAQQAKGTEAKIAAQLEVAAQYGVQIKSFESAGRMQLCYDGEAYRRVMALPAASELQKARAALGLTRGDCIDPATPPLQKIALDAWRAELLDKVKPIDLPEFMKNRLHMRRASVWASIAYQRSRKAENAAAQQAAQRAIDELAAVNKAELPDEDQASYFEAGVRAGSVRWAAQTPPAQLNFGKLQLISKDGQPGETCLSLFDSQSKQTLVQRCSYSVIWTASASLHPAGNALALAAQPLDGWRELWLLHETAAGWVIDVLPPAASEPDVGIAEFAGWVPNTKKLLLAREARVEGRSKRSFEVLSMESLQTEVWADKPSALSLFARWQDANWKRSSLMLR